MAQKRLADSETDDLEKYFTDVEYLRGLFADFVAAKELPKRILDIHGVGGVGKSSLLRMFRLHAKSVHVPIALTSAEEAKSAVDVLANWADDLKLDGITLGNFQKTLVHYKAIQAKVEDQAKKAQEARKKAAEKVGTAVAKAVIGAAISLIPGGAIVNALGGIGVDALVDWLSGFLTKPDIDLLLDPTKVLTKDFLEDIAKNTRKHRLILIVDTFEQMSALNDWVCDTAKQIDSNLLLVISGREMVNWDRRWDGWLAHTQVEELNPMTEDHMRALVRRYYATMVGGEPDQKQVEAIIAFARGLPMVVATAVRLWVKYRQDFDVDEHRAEVYGDIVKRLREGVPPEILPVLEAAASVRWFDIPILRAVTKLKDVSAAYEELRRFPFVKSRKEGLSLHDSVREIIDETLHVDDPDRHKDLHDRAAKHFETKLKKASGIESEKLELERLYHRVRANEKTGILLFQEIAEALAQYHMVNRLRTLVNDATSYPLKFENSKLWVEYYSARAEALVPQWAVAEEIFQKIVNNSQVEPRLRAYALCDLGYEWAKWQHLGKPEGIERAIKVLKDSLALVPLDTHLASSNFNLAHVFQYSGDWESSSAYLGEAKKFYESKNDNYGLANSYANLMIMNLHIGDFKKIHLLDIESKEALSRLPGISHSRANILQFASTRVLLGHYAESEMYARQSLAIITELGEVRGRLEPLRWLGLSLALQSRFDEAMLCCKEHLEINQKMGEYYIKDAGHGHEIYGMALALQGKYVEAENHLLQSLAIKEKVKENIWKFVTLVRLGNLQEMKQKWEAALDYYRQSLEMDLVKHKYFHAAALVGILRVGMHQNDFDTEYYNRIFVEAEQIAIQYELNDHLASIWLVRGHICSDPDEKLHCYQQTLVYALRFNRFLLDEIFSGRRQGSLHYTITSYCMNQKQAGQQVLLKLQEWWKTGSNDVGISQPDSVSPIPEGISLLESERLARVRESGNGTVQKNILEQIDMALNMISINHSNSTIDTAN